MSPSRARSGKPQTIPVFTDSALVQGARNGYVEITVDLARVVHSWRVSLMAHEWLDRNGFVKADSDIKPLRLERRQAVRAAMAAGQALEKPVLGIGMFDNVEIGSGTDVLVTLYMDGLMRMPVHVRASQAQDFMVFKV